MRYYLIFFLLIILFGCPRHMDMIKHGPMNEEQEACLQEQRYRARPRYEAALERYYARKEYYDSCYSRWEADFYEQWTSCIYDQQRYARGECRQPPNRCGGEPRRPDLDDFVNMKLCR